MSDKTALQVIHQNSLQAPETLESLIERFLGSQDVAQASVSTYRRQIRQFVNWLQECGIEEPFAKEGGLQSEDILSYKQALLASGKSARTVSGYLTAVRKLFEWLEAKRIYPNVARSVKGAKRPKGHAKDVLTQEQLRAALAGITTSTLEGLRDYALFNLLARTGLRTIEINRATVGDLRQIGGQAVLFVQGKGHDSKDDYVILTEKALSPLRQYLAARGPAGDDQPLFCSHSDRSKGDPLATRSIRYIVKQALRRIGLDDHRLTAHSLRHTAITLAILGGASLVEAQSMARHTDPKTTQGYFHDLNRVQNAAEKLIDF